MKNVIKASIAVLVTICLVSACAYVMHSKTWYPKMSEFYNNTEEYDVWYLGSSHAIMSTLPEEMWKEYSIRSYNLACYGQTLAMDYWITKNLMKISKPKLVVIDVGVIASEEKYSEANIGSVRKMVSGLPFSLEKIHMIDDIFEGDMREEMFFPFSSDHYNWEYLTEDNFVLKESYELGSDQNVFGGRGKEDYVLVTQTVIPGAISLDDASEIPSLNSGYLRKLIELCKDNDIEVLLTKCPLNASEEDQNNYAGAFKIGQEYDALYYDGFYPHGVYDGDTDMWDERHLNSLGARKYTHELGEYILENYADQIDISYGSDVENRWDERYSKYLLWLDTELPLQTDLYSYLMLCTHPQYSVKVEMNETGNAKNDDIVWKFIDTMENCEVSEVNGTDFDIHIVVYNADGIKVDEERFSYNEETIAKYLKMDE